MALLINNAGGLTADTTNATATVWYNPDPNFAQNNFITSIYAWATSWSGASVQIYVAPQRKTSPWPAIWFPVGTPITQNTLFTFQHRWAQIQAVVTGATAETTGLFTDVFNGW